MAVNPFMPRRAVRAPDIVILRALGLGDLLTAVPALRALRRSFPSYRIALAAPVGLRPLGQLIGAVDQWLPTPGLGPIDWDGRPPVLAVNLHGRGPQSHRTLLALGPSRLMAYANPQVPVVDGPQWNDTEHEVARWCRLVRCYGLHANPHDLALRRPDRVGPVPGAVIIHPGAGAAHRRWPPERFAAVARELRADGELVVITGSPAERRLAEQVAAAAGLPHQAVLAGDTETDELAAIVADARLLVCGDTGVGHLATAYGTASVLLFGAVQPAIWGPPAGRRQHVVLWAGQPCDETEPVNAPAAGLLSISVDDVAAAARRALAATSPPAPPAPSHTLSRTGGTAA